MSIIKNQIGDEPMIQEHSFKITDNAYFDILIKYNGNPESLRQFEQYSIQLMSDTFAVIYVPIAQIGNRVINEFGYSAIPKCYSLTDLQSLEASGITRLRRVQALNLRGNGVLVGIIDTGIDYTNPLFRHPDGTTRIAAIWDQSIESTDRYPRTLFPAYFGTEYTADQINEALRSPNPLQIVPSMDEIGHGTALAGIAAGSEDRDNDFSGVAPDAELLIVKLKKAKQNLMDFFLIPEDAVCYQENDIIWAVKYLVDTAIRLRKPIAICIGLGTSQGSHDDSGFLNETVSVAGDFPEVAITTSAGNEGNRGRHFSGTVNPGGGPVEVNLAVGEGEASFSFEFWGTPPMIYTLDITAPNGEYIPPITGRLRETRSYNFIFDKTTIDVDYEMIESNSGLQVILLRFINPTQGTWRFNVYGRGDLRGTFHMWLPSGNFISENTTFFNADPYTTITSPGTVIVPITLTAYNSNTNTLYPNAGRGYPLTNEISPNLAAPGVNILCPGLNHSYIHLTGTSAAAAHTAGITALILEWSILQGNYPGLDTIAINNFLIRGASRSTSLQYPNREWGYGIIELFNAYNFFRNISR